MAGLYTGQPTNHNYPLLAPRVCFELGPQAKCSRNSIKQHSTKRQRKAITQIILYIEAGSLFCVVSDLNLYSRETMLFPYSKNGMRCSVYQTALTLFKQYVLMMELSATILFLDLALARNNRIIVICLTILYFKIQSHILHCTSSIFSVYKA